MIERYTRDILKTIWTDAHKFATYLMVEKANVYALHQRGLIDANTFESLNLVSFSLDRIEFHEAQLHHDVLAFAEACRETLGEDKRWFHFGLTSSDVIDTAHSLLLKEANSMISRDIDDLLLVLKEKAMMYQHTPIMARTHGMYAEPTIYGLRYALWYDDLKRLTATFIQARSLVEVCKASGSIGTYPILPPDHESVMATKLELSTSALHSQVIQRDRYATYISSLVNLAGLIEKMMLDIRLLSRSDVGEVAEAFGTQQKGSSAMPHKKNPISGENLTGLARMMRGYLNPMFENQALWHERDISHSSVERIILQDATTLLDYMLSRATKTLNNLVVYPERMQEHVSESYDTGASQWILHQAILQGIDRDEAYQSLQTASFKAIEQRQSLWTTLQSTTLATQLNLDTIQASWKPFTHIQAIYDRVFNEKN